MNYTHLISIEPRSKVWFSIEHGTIYALPLFGDYSGPFQIQFASADLIDMKLQFDIAPSSSLFSPSNHLLLALFNISSTNYKNSPLNRFLIVRTLSLALNLSESLLTIHRINGSMIKVYFSCDFYSTEDLIQQIEHRIEHFYSRRLSLISSFPLPLIEISVVRLLKGKLHLKTVGITDRPKILSNRTGIPSGYMANPFLNLQQFYQPLVIVPLVIILIGLLVCSVIALCLCCNRRSASSSTLLLPSGPSGSPNNKHLYENYAYRRHRQQQQFYKKRLQTKDQRPFISKGKYVFKESVILTTFQCHFLLCFKEFR